MSSIELAGSSMREVTRWIDELRAMPERLPELGVRAPMAARLLLESDLRCCCTRPSNGTFFAPGMWPSRWSLYSTCDGSVTAMWTVRRGVKDGVRRCVCVCVCVCRRV